MADAPTTEAAAEVRLTREAAVALLEEAHSEFKSGAEELFHRGDEGRRPTIAASVELIGRLTPLVEWRWPCKDTEIGKVEEPFASVGFTEQTLDWLRWDRDQMRGYIADVDNGESGGGESAYIAGQVYLLHVLEGIVRQLDEGKAA